jgi:hypothetical protein
VVDDWIGTGLAITGAVFGGIVNISIRTITKYARLHFMVVPLGFNLGGVALCPLLLFLKLLNNPVDPISVVPPEASTPHHSASQVSSDPGVSLHVYNWVDVCLILANIGFSFVQ